MIKGVNRMKKYMSVMMLAARNSIYKIIGLLVVTGAVQLGVFYLLINRITDWKGAYYDFVLDQSSPVNWIAVISGISLVLVCMLLIYPECEYGGSRISYSIGRLQAAEKSIFFLWTIYHVIILMIFWFVQILIAYGACVICLNQPGAASMADAQSIFLAFYLDDFLHSLMPLHESSRYIRNVFLILGMAFSISDFSWKQRRGRKSFSIVVLLAVTLIFFRQETGHFMSDMMISLAAVVCIGIAAYELWVSEG